MVNSIAEVINRCIIPEDAFAPFAYKKFFFSGIMGNLSSCNFNFVEI